MNKTSVRLRFKGHDDLFKLSLTYYIFIFVLFQCSGAKNERMCPLNSPFKRLQQKPRQLIPFTLKTDLHIIQ